jgi:CubicO group peptidase (beta-lactamase class C family)
MYVANVWDESLTNFKYPTWMKEYYRTDGVYYQNDSWIHRTPGTKVDKFEYSNAGYTLLGYLLELITNSTYQEYLINNILTPLNMSSTNASYEAFSSSILADTYDPITGGRIEPFNVNERGAGSLRSNVNDLTIYLQAHMSKTKLIESNVLNETTINLMHKDYGRYYSGAVGYGHGWLNYDGLTGHTGAMRNFATRMLWDESEGIGVVLLNNYVLNIIHIQVDEELFSLLLEIGKDPSLLSTVNCDSNTQSTDTTISDDQTYTECRSNPDYRPYLISLIVPLLIVSAVLIRRRVK